MFAEAGAEGQAVLVARASTEHAGGGPPPEGPPLAGPSAWRRAAAAANATDARGRTTAEVAERTLALLSEGHERDTAGSSDVGRPAREVASDGRGAGAGFKLKQPNWLS